MKWYKKIWNIAKGMSFLKFKYWLKGHLKELPVWVHQWDTDEGTGCELYLNMTDAMDSVIHFAVNYIPTGKYAEDHPEEIAEYEEWISQLKEEMKNEDLTGFCDVLHDMQTQEYFGIDTHIISQENLN
jgi:hypothetical protein